MTDYSDYMARDDIRTIEYVMLSGLPYVFSHAPQPTDYTLPAGYTWSQTFVRYRRTGETGRRSTLKSIAQKIDIERGTTVSGNLTLEFAFDPEDSASLWFDLLVPTTRNTYHIDPTYLVTPSSQAFRLLDVGSLAATDELHAGAEALTIRAIEDPYIYCDRGKYQSSPDWYGIRGGAEGDPRGGYQEITDWPDTWHGRTVSVWQAACGVVQGERVPLSTAIQGTYDQEIFRGPVAELDWNPGVPGLKIKTQSLEQLLTRPILSRARSYNPGPSMESPGGWVYVERFANDWVSWDDGEISGRVDIPDGLWNVGALLNYAIDAINDSHVFMRLNWQTHTDEDEEAQQRIRFGATRWVAGADELIRPFTFKISTSGQIGREALRAVGCSEDVVISPGRVTVHHEFWWVPILNWEYADATDAIPHFHLSVNNTRLYYHGLEGTANLDTDDPPHLQGSVRRDGSVDRPHVRFQGEVMEVQFRADTGAGLPFLDEDYPTQTYAKILNRHLCGTSRVNATVPWGTIEDEEQAVVVGLGFEDHDMMDVLRWLMCSNGDHNTSSSVWPAEYAGWNALPDGYGASIPTGFIDHPQFERIHGQHEPITNGWWLEGQETLREILGKVGLAYGLNFLPSYGSGSAADMGGRYQISCYEVAPPPLAGSSVALIDESWTNSMVGAPIADINERNVINRITFSFDYSVSEREYDSVDNQYIDVVSSAKYGESRPLHVELPWIRGDAESRDVIQSLAGWVFSTRGIPAAVYTIPYYRPLGWTLQVHDVVTVTHPYLPDYRSGGQGLTAEPMQVIGNDRDYGASGRSFGKLTLLHRSHFRAREYCPSLILREFVSGTTYTVALNMNDGGFTRAGDGTERDIEHYLLMINGSGRVHRYIPGIDVNETTNVGTVDVAASTITFSATTSLTPVDQVVVDFRESAVPSAVDEQEDYAYLSDSETLTFKAQDDSQKPGARWL